MNKQVANCYAQIAGPLGLAVDASGVIYGKEDGFDVTVLAPNASYPYMLQIQVSALRPGGVLTNDEVRALRRAAGSAAKIRQQGSVIQLPLKNALGAKRAAQKAVRAVEALSAFLREHGFYNACQSCGRPGMADACIVGGDVMHLCPACYAQAQQGKALQQQCLENTKENVAAGAVGALLGSLVGVACIVLLSQLGYVAALSGLLMAVCALKGYELLGGKLTKVGAAVTLALMLVMTFAGDQIDWAIVISRELGWSFFESLFSVQELIRMEMIDAGAYWGNLALLYLFLLLGAGPAVLGALKKRKAATIVYHLGDAQTPQA